MEVSSMNKLRNAKTEIGGFAQWIARKCVNHHPLSELRPRPMLVEEVAAGGRMVKGQRPKVGIVLKEGVPVILYEFQGRTFALEVREVDATVYSELLQHKHFAVGS